MKLMNIPCTKNKSELLFILSTVKFYFESISKEDFENGMSADLDWLFIVQQSLDHGIFPQLYHSLKQCRWSHVPEDVVSLCHHHSRQINQNNLTLTTELCTIIESFEKAGIKAIPFKGPVLSYYLYGDVTQRQFNDLDILVSKEDLPEADNIIQRMGYKNNSLNQVCAGTFNHYHFHYDNKEKNIHVEIHWDIMLPQWKFAYDLESMFRHCKEFPLYNTNILGLSEKDMFVMLCLHGLKHSWKRVLWICDITAFIKKSQEMSSNTIPLLLQNQKIRNIILFTLFHAASMSAFPIKDKALLSSSMVQKCIKLQTIINMESLCRQNTLSSYLGIYLFSPFLFPTFTSKILYAKRQIRRVPKKVFRISPADREIMEKKNLPLFCVIFIRPLRIVSKLSKQCKH